MDDEQNIARVCVCINIEIANENVIFQYWTEADPTNAHTNTSNILFIIHMEKIA
jgi:hypothetical protein